MPTSVYETPIDSDVYQCERPKCKNPATLKRSYLKSTIFMFLCEECAHPVPKGTK